MWLSLDSTTRTATSKFKRVTELLKDTKPRSRYRKAADFRYHCNSTEVLKNTKARSGWHAATGRQQILDMYDMLHHYMFCLYVTILFFNPLAMTDAIEQNDSYSNCPIILILLLIASGDE